MVWVAAAGLRDKKMEAQMVRPCKRREEGDCGRRAPHGGGWNTSKRTTKEDIDG